MRCTISDSSFAKSHVARKHFFLNFQKIVQSYISKPKCDCKKWKIKKKPLCNCYALPLACFIKAITAKKHCSYLSQFTYFHIIQM